MDDPSKAERIVSYTTADGLSNNSVLSFTEDQWGRIYACTGRGIDRLDPTTGRIKHYTTAEGLVAMNWALPRGIVGARFGLGHCWGFRGWCRSSKARLVRLRFSSWDFRFVVLRGRLPSLAKRMFQGWCSSPTRTS